MNDKKTISVYLPSFFLLEIDNFVKANNIASRGGRSTISNTSKIKFAQLYSLYNSGRRIS